MLDTIEPATTTAPPEPATRTRLAVIMGFSALGVVCVLAFVSSMGKANWIFGSNYSGAYILAESEPSGASVLVNGKLAGSTPARIYGLAEGWYALRFERTGCETCVRRVDYRGSTVTIAEKLNPLPYGTLVIDIVPKGAEVLLDEELVGHTPLRLEHVPVGHHELLIRKTNFDSYSKRLEILPAEETQYSGFELRDKYLTFLNDQIKTEPQRVAHYIDLGHYLFINDKMEEAAEIYARGAKVIDEPLNFDGPGYAGQAQMSSTEMALEQRLRQEDNARFGKEMDKHRQWGHKATHLFRMKYDEARADLARNTKSWAGAKSLADSARRKGKYEEAARRYNDFISLDPAKGDLAFAYVGLLEVYCLDREVRKTRVLETFDKFYSIFKDDSTALHYCGATIYQYYVIPAVPTEQLVVLEVAERAERRAIELANPEKPIARTQMQFELGMILYYEATIHSRMAAEFKTKGNKAEHKNCEAKAIEKARQSLPFLKESAATPDKDVAEDRLLNYAEALQIAGNGAESRKVYEGLLNSKKVSVKESAKAMLKRMDGVPPKTP